MDVGPLSGMNGGLIKFMETTDVPGGTLQFLHGTSFHTTHSDNRNAPFIYYRDVKDGEVKSIPFLKSLLAKADKGNALNIMD